MSIVITLRNEAKLKKAGRLLGAKNGAETVEMALEKVIEDYEQKSSAKDLPESFFEDLFNENNNLSDGESIEAILKEREESDF